MNNQEMSEILYDAVRYVLNRAQIDPEFRWHMLGTESMDRLVNAEAKYLRRDPQNVMAERCEDAQPSYRKREPDCKINRCRVRELEGILEAHGIELPTRE
jgi:hypothetical protein